MRAHHPKNLLQVEGGFLHRPQGAAPDVFPGRGRRIDNRPVLERPGPFRGIHRFFFLIPVQKSVLSLTYLPLGNLVPYGGMVFIIGGLALLWTAHRQLGKEFSTTLTVPSERKLITKGIYACIRHPIYSAYCLFFFGIAMLSSSWLAALTAGTLMYILMGPRLKKEEALLESVFGQEFLLWAGRTGRFLPRWNHRGRRAG
jgi:protein-S-isoprenylcysteine O-methyltransferase Ste14